MRKYKLQARLNADNPARPLTQRALDILEKYQQAGHEDADIIIHALVTMEGEAIPKPSRDTAVNKLLTLSARLEGLIETMEGMIAAVGNQRIVYADGERAGQEVDFGMMNQVMQGMRAPAVWEEDGEDD